VTHEQIVEALHRAHLTHQGEDPDIIEDCAVCAMYAEWAAPLIEEARAAGVVEQLDRDAEAVAAAERRVRKAVWDYCEYSAVLSEEASMFGNAYAIGLAKGYRDIQDKLTPALAEGT
jgi:hypothetical protein